jgi:hypothetical protein
MNINSMAKIRKSMFCYGKPEGIIIIIFAWPVEKVKFR